MPAQPGFRRFGAGLAGGGQSYGGMAKTAIGQGQQAGAFGLQPSPQIRQSLEQGAMRRAESLRHRGETTASIAGLDPASARQSMFNLEGQIGGDTSDFLSDANLQELMGNRDWLRQLFGNERGFEQDKQMAQFQADLEKKARGGGFMSQVGNLLGSAAGSAIPGFNWARMLSGGGGGGGNSAPPRMGQSGYRYPRAGGN